MKKNDRLQALRLLIKFFQEQIPLSHLMQATVDLSPLAKEICFGVARHYYRLEAIAEHLVDKRPKTQDLWLVLLIGLYQLHFMRKPDYAVVKETVALVDKLKKSWAKGLVNAVLRTFMREQEQIFLHLQQNEAFIYGHPHWFIARVRADWPDDWQKILQANDEHPPMSLRINSQYGSRDEYLERLRQAGISAYPHLASPLGLQLELAADVKDLPGFASGEVSVQDESAQLAVPLLALKPGLRVLDACCAPGGKTCQILETESQLAACVALDLDARRLERVTENLSRLHLQATVLQGDGLKPETWWDGQLFERILLDAPCSATGVIRRHPDIKILRTEEDIAKVAVLQAALLQSLWPLLAAGGLLVYATCSLMRQENEEQIARFIAKQPDCHFLDTEQPWGRATGHGWQILPGEANRDGFFYSVLKKE